MAKKKSSLTPEQRLQEALVPESEWPYQVPKNWCWVTLGELIVIKRGASPRPIKAYTTDNVNGVNWIKIGDADDGKYINQTAEKITYDGAQKSVFVQKGTLLLSNSMSFGRPYILNVDGCIHDGWLALEPSIAFIKDYLYYGLLASNWYFEQVAVGTAVRNLNSQRVHDTPFVLPPISEQQRIVDRIESLFAQLDEAKQKAQDVVDGFQPRKAAILHKAFTGELTQIWRKTHGVGMESWKKRKLSDIAILQSGIMKGKHNEGPTLELPYLRVANVQDGFLKLDEIKLIQVELSKVDRYKLQKGDVLFTEGGDFDKLGRGTVWEGEIENCLHQNHVFVVRPNVDLLNPYFLSLQAGSRYGKTYFLSCAKQTTNLASINSTQLKNFPVLVPMLSEQQKILHILDDLLSKEQQAKEAAEAVLEQIDLIKKSILARAFRGELSTNDPSEESSVELLREILQKEA